jgi:Domain of unknown function (DUF4172)
MTWNWLQPDWPDFTWNRDRLAAAEKEFVLGSGVFLGAIKHLGDADRNQLTVEAMSTEALTTGSLRYRAHCNDTGPARALLRRAGGREQGQ